MAKRIGLMNRREMERALMRIAEEIVTRNKDTGNLAIVGIIRRGGTLARRLSGLIERMIQREVEFGSMDITLYRDDLQMVAEAPIIKGSEIPFDINGKTVVLVDDVLFTGRTIRAAISEILDYGRPRAVQLAVLVDRGHRELPICADYVGKKIETERENIIDIYVEEEDGEEGVFMTGHKGARKKMKGGL